MSINETKEIIIPNGNKEKVYPETSGTEKKSSPFTRYIYCHINENPM